MKWFLMTITSFLVASAMIVTATRVTSTSQINANDDLDSVESRGCEESRMSSTSNIETEKKPKDDDDDVDVDPALYRHPIYENGRYRSAWTPFTTPNLANAAKWSLFSKDKTSIPNDEELNKNLPIVPLIADEIREPPEDGIRVTWLGHSSVLVQFDGVSVLTDPMFSQRPFDLQNVGPKKRFRPFPGRVSDLPPKLNAVVISHNHYDHLDHDSVKALNDRYGTALHWFVPVGLKEWMHKAGCDSVTELTWWAETTLPYNDNVRFRFTPAQHWSKRSPADDNQVLWGSWCIVGPRHSFFFTGDTAYCDAFKLIGKKYGPFDLAAIPIGAYHPRWFLYHQHVDPKDAVRIHKDVRADKSFGIHWGTFMLSKEEAFYLEPKTELAKRVREACLTDDDFFVLKHGENRMIYKKKKIGLRRMDGLTHES